MNGPLISSIFLIILLPPLLIQAEEGAEKDSISYFDYSKALNPKAPDRFGDTPKRKVERLIPIVGAENDMFGDEKQPIYDYFLGMGPEAVPFVIEKLGASLDQGVSDPKYVDANSSDLPDKERQIIERETGLLIMVQLSLQHFQLDRDTRDSLIGLLQRSLASPYEQLRRRTIYLAVGALGTEGVDLILTAVNDRQGSVQATALAQLLRIADQHTADKLEAVLDARAKALGPLPAANDWAITRGREVVNELREKFKTNANAAAPAVKPPDQKPVQKSTPKPSAPIPSTVDHSSLPSIFLTALGVLIVVVAALLLRRKSEK